MRRVIPLIVGLVFAAGVHQADAAVPRAITALFGPSIGYLMAQSDLCGWNLNGQIQTTYQRDFAVLGMTPEQIADVWVQAKARQAKLEALPPKALAGMKGGICTPDSQAFVTANLAD